MVQDTFLQYLRSDREFDSEEHIKAWLLRTAINKAKNLRMAFWHRNKVSLEDYLATIPFENPMDHELIDAVLSLPQKYRLVVRLYYCEDYSVKEISAVLTQSEKCRKEPNAQWKTDTEKHADSSFLGYLSLRQTRFTFCIDIHNENFVT